MHKGLMRLLPAVPHVSAAHVEQQIKMDFKSINIMGLQIPINNRSGCAALTSRTAKKSKG